MKIKAQSFFTIFFVAVSLFAVVVALHWDFKTALVPVLCGGIVCILSFIQVMKELKGSKTDKQIMDSGFKQETTVREINWGAIRYFGWLVGLYLSILIIGLYPSLALFVFLYLLASRQVSIVSCGTMAVVVAGIVYLIISQLAQHTLPDPWLYRLFL